MIAKLDPRVEKLIAEGKPFSFDGTKVTVAASGQPLTPKQRQIVNSELRNLKDLLERNASYLPEGWSYSDVRALIMLAYNPQRDPDGAKALKRIKKSSEYYSMSL